MGFNIWNRRYTGSKYKLSDWLIELITKNCKGEVFAEIFAGTAVLTSKLIPIMKKIYINDFLYSNEIIYEAFFGEGSYDKEKILAYKNKYEKLFSNSLEDNYVSKFFGGKYFSYNDAKKIGFIREDIEKNSSNLTKKEKNILIASLLYSIDKIANTVGHYDAYIKKNSLSDKFIFNCIEPCKFLNKKIYISRKDANELVKKLVCDIVYIDPPYNSRQYSRFYHLLENIACWKKPMLSGEALKPPVENMSEYCRVKAKVIFADLILKLKCKYIVVSYNNTYASKSKTSQNKIQLKDIKEILEKKGNVKIFEKKYKYFNTGKTDFIGHKEFIFIVKVGKTNGGK